MSSISPDDTVTPATPLRPSTEARDALSNVEGRRQHAAGTPAADRGREFWRAALLAGAVTALPRWTRKPVAGVGEHDTRIPDELVAALRRLANELAVPLSTVLLTAHAKVLGALSGECEVSTGYVAMKGRSPLLCRMTTEPRSWRALLLETHRAALELLPHADFPVEDLRRELRLTEPLFETVFDATADGRGELAEDTVLWVGILAFDRAQPTLSESRGVEGDRLVLRLRYRTDVLDAKCAARIAGYHLTALAFIARDPDAEHKRQSLLSAEELYFQLNGLTGPRRKLPDCRVHELFEQRVGEYPDAIAAVHGSRQLTYGELNARANQLARALLARGLRREGVVAVVTERNLDWMAAVLAIFKAGGAYLPIEPHFPADRIARTLSRAGCRLVLTERGSTAMLDQALASLSGVQTLFIDAAYEEGHPDGNLGVNVAPDQLAYIYFTSGSTGEPKGAMCEHAGMLNHLRAKIEDLNIGEGDVVAQTAPQCFDISLWQLVSALLAGGRTLLVEQDAILDAKRFVEKIVDGRAAVVQVVPSYLEVLLSYLAQHPRELPDLRYVSVTGEALKKELTQRWFAAQPGIKLVNAYGLTETSDDTNHEVMDSPPLRERVPLGRPINNVHAYVVDEHLSPVPLGAPGELVFSGVCVGRGYVNDPDRTRRAFLADPHREGQRLYRSGDYGRWLPEGKLEFLGRRDAQVKISGFRIEIGEIENKLLRVPGVREGAVVVTEGADHNKYLVAFYSGQGPLDGNVLRDRLRESLPEYMVPPAFHWRSRLPLTDNGKIDRKALTALAGELNVAENRDGPGSATEHRVAAAWAKVLGIPMDQIGRRDQFFALGGTSLSALKLVIALDRAVSFKDVTDHPILADLATLLDGRGVIDQGGCAPADPPTRSLAGTPESPLRSRELTRCARSLP
jgi:amino acid adenylation domain-containing protein